MKIPSAYDLDGILGDIKTEYANDVFLVKVFGTIFSRIRSGNENPLDLSEVCSLLCVSERTLYRRLNECGKTYLEVKDEVRKRYAFYLLSSNDYSVDEISKRLFFKNSSSCIQCIKRLYGITPKKLSKRISENLEQKVISY